MTLDDLARAMVARSNGHDPEGLQIKWDDLHEADKDFYRDCALAVASAVWKESQ